MIDDPVPCTTAADYLLYKELQEPLRVLVDAQRAMELHMQRMAAALEADRRASAAQRARQASRPKRPAPSRAARPAQNGRAHVKQISESLAVVLDRALACDGCGRPFSNRMGKKRTPKFKTLCGECRKALRARIARESRPLQIERELPDRWYLGLAWRDKQLFRSWVEMHPRNDDR